VDWKSLNANQVAEWLERLTSDNRSIRLSGYQNLDTKVIDIGSESWESYGPIEELLKTHIPLLITPFLIQLLENPSTQGKETIVLLLTDLANKVYFDIDKLKNEDDRVKASRIFEAVQEGIPIYQNLYETAAEATRKAVIELLRIVGQSPSAP
jgi:hypothetical protein